MSTDAGEEEALRAIAPIIRTSVENALRCGPAAALTGPIERGDAATVRRHAAAIQESLPGLTALYALLGALTIEVAEA